MPARLLFRVVFRFLFHRVLTVNTPIGRKLRPRILSRGGPLIRVNPRDIATAGIDRVPRVVGVRDGLPMLADHRVLDVSNVIWCTGLHPEFSWIDLPGFDPEDPWRHCGIIPSQPGLYFVGLLSLRDVVVDDPRRGTRRRTCRHADRVAIHRRPSAGSTHQIAHQ